MPTASTTLLGLALPVTGELTGTWGDVVNNSLTSLLDTAIAGTTTLSTDADVTLTTTVLLANQARQPILLCTGARTALRTITAPSQSKTYVVINSTTGGFAIKVAAAGPTTGVTIAAGRAALIAWNGSDFVSIATNDITSLSGTLPVSSGGTGATTLSGLLVGNGTSPVTAVTAPSGTVVGTTDTQTLTNKRITPRVVSITSSASITPNGDTTDQYNVTALAVPATINAPTGTPTDGQKFVLRIEDDGTARALTWTTTSGAYRVVGTTLPTTTVATKVLYVGCIYNSTDVFWDVVGVTQQV